ncbi:MAG: DUF1761 domain-containing protein, partial [Phycisphaerales bacterium]
LVAGLAIFMFGGLWYALLFAKAWVKVYAFTEEQVKQMTVAPAKTYGALLVCDLIVAAGVAMLINACGVTGAGQGAALGGVVGLLVVAPQVLQTQVASARPVAGWVIDGGKMVLGTALAGVILGAWQ